MNIFDLAVQKVKLKKASSTNGGEWQGPCPGCGGNDRFHVWPEKGTYWCRGCGKAGDAIQFLRDFEGKSFREACDYLNITMEQVHHPAAPTKKEKPEFQPVKHQNPAQIWQERAEKFVAWAHENLKQNPDIMKLLADRGISAAAVDRHRLGWNPGENGKDLYRPRKSWGLPDEIHDKTGKPKKLWIPIGLVIPYVISTEGRNLILRIRIRRPEGEPRYYVIPGSSAEIMILGPEREAFVTIESELDAIACYEAQEYAGAVATGSSHAKPDARTFKILKNSKQILNALDYDKAGATAMHWWDEQFPENCERWPVPQGKDPGEAYKLGTDLSVWIRAGLPPSLTLRDRVNSEKRKDVTTVQEQKECHCEASLASCGNLNPLIAELYQLLKNNPSVKIINNADRLTIYRNGKYVGGRINELVYREPDVAEYIFSHPDEEINYQNFLKGE